MACFNQKHFHQNLIAKTLAVVKNLPMISARSAKRHGRPRLQDSGHQG
jgi:hypothetical protein